MEEVWNSQGKVIKRIVRTNETEHGSYTKITQVPTSDGGWWNILVERIGAGSEDSH